MSSSKSVPKPKECHFSANSSDSEEEVEDLFAQKVIPDNNGSNSKKLGPKLLVCTDCQPVRYFNRQKVLDLHKEFIHADNMKTYECKQCRNKFRTKQQIRVHQTLYDHK